MVSGKFEFHLRHLKHFLVLIKITQHQTICLKKMSAVFCCKGWGIKSQFCEPLMADVSHYFYSSHVWDDCCTQEQRIEIKMVSK